MSLKKRLAAMKKASDERMPAETKAIMSRAEADLRASGLHERALAVGERAPTFSLPNQNGDLVSSAALLEKGPLAVSFFRGKW